MKQKNKRKWIPIFAGSLQGREKKGEGEEKFEYCTLTDETKKRHDPAREKCIGELGVYVCVWVRIVKLTAKCYNNDSNNMILM